MMKNFNRTEALTSAFSLVFRNFVLGILALLLVTQTQAATDLRITDENPMKMPAVGSYGLRILSPTLLEVTLITTKQPDPAALTEWNFVNNSGVLTPPSASQFAVTAGTQTFGVQSVGFKRRALYAPLHVRDLRIANHLYLQLSSPVADGQIVEVKNPGGALWNTSKQFISQADPLRWNPAIHVNQEGYMPAYQKRAMISYYIGSMGEMSVPSANGFKIINANSGAVVHSGALTLRKDVGYTHTPTPYQQVYQADFSEFQTPGEYRLQIPGMGASFSFVIDEGTAGLFARSYALGLYHQRCGHGNDYPFTRHDKGACHSALVEVPNMTFTAANAFLASMTGDYAASQSGAPQLKDFNSSLYPFVNTAKIDLKGGHHDAGDYSKYTINVAQLAHSLVFAADSHAGVGALDNLGLPESGDGKSDMLQEAKWELDFLAKMQDADGGFYFLVYPKTRAYEDNVSLRGTDLGDSQIVFPKTTAATAAAVAALAQAASSPLFKQQFPAEAAYYLAKAKKGWQFLEAAWNAHGRAGAYQKITHYGNEFRDRDEIAWAACELFLATGEAKYHTELLSTFDPADPNTRRWTWWRLFEGYGSAIRSYAFAARSGRLPSSALNSSFLAKCEAEIIASGDDQVRYSQDNAFGNAFPNASKPYRTAGWFMSVAQIYDASTAYQLSAKQAYLDTIIAAMNYEAGLNPLNMTFLTGVGWKRQRETVNQYAENDRRALPPSGIPLGSLCTKPPYIYNYKNELTALSYPSDTITTGMHAPYDKWTDTFHTETEFVNPQQGHSLAAMAFMMARTAVKTQAWKSATGTIVGLPASIAANAPISATLSVPGVDMSKASLVWEARDQSPTPGSTFNFSAVNSGPQWVEVEALLPDGRRIFAKADFNATTAVTTPPNSYQSSPLPVTGDMVALYHLDDDLSDATGKQNALSLASGAALDSSNLGWMSTRTGKALHALNIGDKAVVATIPNSHLYSTNTEAIVLEAMIYINALKGVNTANSPLVSLVRNWNSSLEFYEDMYSGIKFRGGTQFEDYSAAVKNALPKNMWHHLRISIDKTGYTAKVNGVLVASKASTELANWSNPSGFSTLTLGNFDGWIDEVTIRNVRPGGATTNTVVTAPIISPGSGTFTDSVSVSLGSVTTGATIHYTLDGSTPTTGSTVYKNPITLSSSATVKAFATKSGSINSSIASATFNIVHVVADSPPTNLSSASFVKTDTNTLGNWKGVYGSEGYNIVGNADSYPAYVQATFENRTDRIWAWSTSETRSPLKVTSASDRIAAAAQTTNTLTVSLDMKDNGAHRFAMYFLDWERLGRVQKVEILDAATGEVLDTQSMSSFEEGKYLVWDIIGDVKVRLTRIGGTNAHMQAFFFDPPATIGVRMEKAKKNSNGQFEAEIVGSVGQQFRLETSTDFTTWIPVFTHTLTSTKFSFVDTNSASGTMRLFRAVPLP